MPESFFEVPISASNYCQLQVSAYNLGWSPLSSICRLWPKDSERQLVNWSRLLYRGVRDASLLAKTYPPQFQCPNKQLVYDLATGGSMVCCKGVIFWPGIFWNEREPPLEKYGINRNIQNKINLVKIGLFKECSFICGNHISKS